MGFKWHLICTILCVEMSITVLLLLPCIPPEKWCESLTSSQFQWVVGIMGLPFWSAVITLGVVFGDAVWRHHKCRSLLPKKITNAHQEIILSTWAEMFRAQRNVYISGFLLLLTFVNHRLVDLLIHTAHKTQGNRYMGRFH
ncbi:B-cell receptor-associated protein 29-like [Haliotis rubra]|uniref:B-cell receptor-associated protein 29-like n=1 Tax=Haliotis rubra TaxID=36100 RepID=UPI001EE5817A|nr:B-cell receptor-associated protein 29-like [Haliotis rubra]